MIVKSFKVTLSIEIEGKTEEDVSERYADALDVAGDCDGVRQLLVHAMETNDVPFVVPPGAERWTVGTTLTRFAEASWRPPFAVMYGGSWWWSDAHAMYRCEGVPPEHFKVIPEADAKKVTELGPVRRETDFGDPFPHARQMARRARVDDKIVVDTRYYDTVMAAFPDAVWTCGPDISTPLAASSGGMIVAFVMGMRP